MARVTGPLFSMDASGTVGKAIVFSKWKGRSYVRRHAVPSNPRSGLQVGIRTVFGFVAAAWATLTDLLVSDWTEIGAADSTTGLNALTKDAVSRARRGEGWRADPEGDASDTVTAPTGAAALAALKSLNLSWTNAVAGGGEAPDWCTAIHMAEGSEAIEAGIDNLVAIVPIATEAVVIRGLTTGQAYSFVLRHVNQDGAIGADADLLDKTPT